MPMTKAILIRRPHLVRHAQMLCSKLIVPISSARILSKSTPFHRGSSAQNLAAQPMSAPEHAQRLGKLW